MLHIIIIIRNLLTFPTIPNTVSAVSPTIWQIRNHSYSSTYDFYMCGYTNLGILISLSLTCRYLTHARYLNVAQISMFLLSNFQTFLVVCFQNITTSFLCFSFSCGLLLFFLLFLHYFLFFSISLYNGLQAILQFNILRLLLLIPCQWFSDTHVSNVYSLARI